MVVVARCFLTRLMSLSVNVGFIARASDLVADEGESGIVSRATLTHEPGADVTENGVRGADCADAPIKLFYSDAGGSVRIASKLPTLNRRDPHDFTSTAACIVSRE